MREIARGYAGLKEAVYLTDPSLFGGRVFWGRSSTLCGSEPDTGCSGGTTLLTQPTAVKGRKRKLPLPEGGVADLAVSPRGLFYASEDVASPGLYLRP